MGGEGTTLKFATINNPSHFLVVEFLGNDVWNKDKLSRWLPFIMVSQITKIPIRSDNSDKAVWAPTSDGYFSLLSAWEQIRQWKNEPVVAKVAWCHLLPLK